MLGIADAEYLLPVRCAGRWNLGGRRALSAGVMLPVPAAFVCHAVYGFGGQRAGASKPYRQVALCCNVTAPTD